MEWINMFNINNSASFLWAGFYFYNKFIKIMSSLVVGIWNICKCYVYHFAAVVMDDQDYVVIPRVPGEQEGNAALSAVYRQSSTYHVFKTWARIYYKCGTQNNNFSFYG